MRSFSGTELGAVHVLILAKNVATFCLYSGSLKEVEVNGRGLNYLAENISSQLNIHVVDWLLVIAFSHIYNVSQREHKHMKNA